MTTPAEDPRREPPEGKDTVKFEPPPKWAEAMFTRVHEGIAASEARTMARHDETDAKVDKCIHGLVTVTDEVERVKKEFYEHKGEVVARFDTHSIRAKQESVHDEEQDKQIAQLSKSQMAELLKEVAKTPLGQKVVNGVVLLVLAALGYGTFWLSTHAREPATTAPVVQLLAPVTIYADAGTR